MHAELGGEPDDKKSGSLKCHQSDPVFGVSDLKLEQWWDEQIVQAEDGSNGNDGGLNESPAKRNEDYKQEIDRADCGKIEMQPERKNRNSRRKNDDSQTEEDLPKPSTGAPAEKNSIQTCGATIHCSPIVLTDPRLWSIAPYVECLCLPYVSKTRLRWHATEILVMDNSASAQNTILIVEDDKNLVRVLQIVLSARGYSLITARNGVEGLAQVTDGKPD